MDSHVVASEINPQLAAFPELEPYLLKGVRTTADCKRLGHGSFGVVDQLYFQGTLCAAKQLHGALLDPRTQGVDRIIRRFVEECRIMASVRHPNIVQFLGLHMLPNCTYPTLVMEQLAMSLEDLLNEAIGRREELPLSLKISILTDVAKGLVYLHNHSPQIIHRDLTSRNVLLTLDMQAKITDLGNALIIDSDTVALTMTQTPGTAVYMPPEATQYQAKYDSSIDMFSYGHLALYTAIQQFPKDILPPTFKNEVTKLLSARSEIQRREKYMLILHQKMGDGHLMTQIVKRCLNNEPDERPSALQVLENLESLSKTANGSSDDSYIEYQHYSRLQLVKLLHQQQYAHTNGADTSYVIPHLEGKSVDYLELVNSAPPVGNVSFTPDDSEKIKVSTIL